MLTNRFRLFSVCLLSGVCAAQTAYKSVNPEISRLVADISEERIAKHMQKLGSFGTRDVHSQGIIGARRWLLEELKSYSPKLEVRFDSYRVKKQGRIQRDLELVNVVAVLPGTTQKDRQVILGAHYDSLALVRKKGAAPGDPAGVDWPSSAEHPSAPGVSDDGSGVASVLEIARVMSRSEWKKTMVFVLFAGEEQGLFGSRLHADKLKSANAQVDAVLNMDIIGDDTGGSGQKASHLVRLFSADPSDSPSRSLARYAHDMAERYVPSMKVDLVFRSDRFARGGDHTPFAQRGFPAVRFTEPAENYAHQHSDGDNFANSAPGYTTRVAKVNLATAACLAMASKTPALGRIGRGKSGYDAALKWTADPDSEYVVMIRATTSPLWEREIYVGNVAGYTIENFSIDDVVIGVKAVGKDGFESPVAAYIAADYPDAKIELALLPNQL